MFRRRRRRRRRRLDRERSMVQLRFGRKSRVSNEVRDMSGYTEATLLKRKERGERAHDPDLMVERERWDLLG